MINGLRFLGTVTSSRIDCGGRHRVSVEKVTYSRPIPILGGTISTEMMVEYFGANCFLKFVTGY